MEKDVFLKELYLTLKGNPCLLGSRIALAVSGGIDSMVMLTATAKLLDSPLLRGIRFLVVTIDHGIRKESKDEVEYVKHYAEEYGFPAQIYRISPESSAEHYLHTERWKIWRFLVEKKGVERIWLAHHLDDVEETLLLQLIRGGDIRGLTSMKMCDGIIGRPLLCFRRKDIEEFAYRMNIRYFEDVTNNDISIPRNYIRHVILPMLKNHLPVVAIDRTYRSLLVQREALEHLISDFVRSRVKINEKEAIIKHEKWSVVVEAVIFVLKMWSYDIPGWFIDRLIKLKGSGNGSKLTLEQVDVTRIPGGIKMVRGDTAGEDSNF